MFAKFQKKINQFLLLGLNVDVVVRLTHGTLIYQSIKSENF
jgi:hypothetical protein